MKSSLTRKAIGIFLLYALLSGLAAAGAYADGVVFRQPIRIVNQAILCIGLLTVLLIWIKEIPKERKRKRNAAIIVTAAVCLLLVIGVLFQAFLGIDRETIIEKDGVQKIEVEHSWILLLERSYYDAQNVPWYRKNPHFTEHFDDGDPGQYLYTDYYDESGAFTERIYADCP